MIWLLELALLLMLLGIGWTMLTRNRQSDAREALTLRRVDAYIETIRRERRNAELAAMSDSELRDLLHSGARNLRVAEQKRGWIILSAAAVSLVVASIVGSQEGWFGFVATAAVGALATYGIGEVMTRRMRAPLERHGIDVDRLTVE